MAYSGLEAIPARTPPRDDASAAVLRLRMMYRQQERVRRQWQRIRREYIRWMLLSIAGVAVAMWPGLWADRFAQPTTLGPDRLHSSASGAAAEGPSMAAFAPPTAAVRLWLEDELDRPAAMTARRTSFLRGSAELLPAGVSGHAGAASAGSRMHARAAMDLGASPLRRL
ncbi:MAG: hypothetical protein KF774_15910 [Planctomyces sp.]|nr:hypothetical protein [Planctomyces sp.]